MKAMSPVFILVFVLIVAIFAGANFYIGLRGWQAIGSHLTYLSAKVYWVLFGVMALSYLIGRLGEKYLPGKFSEGVILFGAYWMAAFFYLLVILLVIDIIRLLNKGLNFLPEWMSDNSGINPTFGLIVAGAVFVLIVYGALNARNPHVQRYNVNIDKRTAKISELKVVMISDLHLGTIVKNGQLIKMVEMVNAQNPDLILFAGDVIDESVEPFIEQQMANSFKDLKAQYGVYAALGNHEYIGGNADDVVQYLKSAGVIVLRDEAVKVADSFNVVGREDSSRERFDGVKRKPLEQVLGTIDRALPIIVLDHQPNALQEAQTQGVDLQFSGHTHRGQLFPIQFITSAIFEIDWGYLRKDNYQLIVSSGYGTWGPPVRIGNKPEIVEISLHFGK